MSDSIDTLTPDKGTAYRSPLRAIRLKCLDCSAGSAREVIRCAVIDCSLWVYRLGRRPGTVEARQPKLLDRVYVLLAGAVDDFPDSLFAQQLLAEPRKYYPQLLAAYSDEQIAEVVTRIRATPRVRRFPGLSADIDSGAPQAGLGGPADESDDLDDPEVDLLD